MNERAQINHTEYGLIKNLLVQEFSREEIMRMMMRSRSTVLLIEKSKDFVDYKKLVAERTKKNPLKQEPEKSIKLVYTEGEKPEDRLLRIQRTLRQLLRELDTEMPTSGYNW